MSAFAVCFHRNGGAADPALLESMLAAQKHRGDDALGTFVEGSLAMGCHELWTTPEQEGKRNPISLGNYTLVWDGRIDNRADLYAFLDGDCVDPAALSDAELFLRLYQRKQNQALNNIIGAFALAVYDRHQQSVTLARDPLGQRSISYYLRDHLLIGASEDGGVLACPRISRQLDMGRLAVFFSGGGLDNDSTYYKDLKRVMPGHYLAVRCGGVSSQRYWVADTGRRLRYRDDHEYAQHYRELLESAVGCRMRASGPVAVMTSGGLDSGPIAAVAAGQTASPSTSVHALSWAFDQYPRCDERAYVEPLVRRLGMTPLWVNCDHAGPLSDFPHWPVHPHTPEQDPYRRFLDRSYETAKASGIRVVLNGACGDTLYAAGDRWFWDLCSRGRPGAALSAASWFIRQKGAWPFVRNILLRSLIAERFIRRLRPRQPPEWLTDQCRELTRFDTRWPPEKDFGRRPWQCALYLDATFGDWFSAETYWGSQHDIEVRYPFRDRRLVEFMLQVPDDQLRLADVTRPILRRAVSDLLPPAQLKRQDKTDFTPLFDHGFQRVGTQIDDLLNSSTHVWSQFIKQDWVTGDAAPTKATKDILLWNALSMELWRLHSGLTTLEP